MLIALFCQEGDTLRECKCGDGVPLALALGLVFDIVDSVSATLALLSFPVLALCAQELLSECGVVVDGGGFLNNNLLPVIGDLVDDPLGRLSKLEVVECRDALRGDGDTMVLFSSRSCGLQDIERGQMARSCSVISSNKHNAVYVPRLGLFYDLA